MTQHLHIGLLAADLTMKHGWAAYTLQLARALRDAGARLTIVASRNSPPLDGATVLPILPTLDPRERGEMLKVLRALPAARTALRDCNIIHTAAEPFAPLGALVAGSRPFFVTGHGSYVRVNHVWRFPMNKLVAWAFRRGTLVCVSHYTERAARDAVPGVKTVVVNNGVDAARYAGVTPMPHDTPSVLAVGAVKARKGTLELVRAMAKVREEISDARCTIIGNTTTEPHYVDKVRAEIARLNLGDAVQLPGYVSDEALMSAYATADVFALPSMNAGWKFEGYGLSLMEASAAGLPVIGTRDCGAEDAVDDGVTGLLVSQERIGYELPAALIALLRDPEHRARMGAAGREKAQRQTWDVVAGQMMNLYSAKY